MCHTFHATGFTQQKKGDGPLLTTPQTACSLVWQLSGTSFEDAGMSLSAWASFDLGVDPRQMVETISFGACLISKQRVQKMSFMR